MSLAEDTFLLLELLLPPTTTTSSSSAGDFVSSCKQTLKIITRISSQMKQSLKLHVPSHSPELASLPVWDSDQLCLQSTFSWPAVFCRAVWSPERHLRVWARLLLPPPPPGPVRHPRRLRFPMGENMTHLQLSNNSLTCNNASPLWGTEPPNPNINIMK